jgi:hypothetical protein
MSKNLFMLEYGKLLKLLANEALNKGEYLLNNRLPA